MNIAEARALAQPGVGDPPVYSPIRVVSIFPSRFLARWNISPDALTLLHLMVLVVAALLIATSSGHQNLAAAAVLILSLIVDCVDGEVARLTNRSSKLGAQLEQVAHWVGSSAIVFGATVYTTRLHAPADWPWPVGFIAAVGWASFHFNYNQLNLYADRSLDHRLLRRITRVLYVGMPLDVNLLLLGTVFRKVDWALIASALLSNAAFATSFAFYYKTERAARLAAFRSPPSISTGDERRP